MSDIRTNFNQPVGLGQQGQSAQQVAAKGNYKGEQVVQTQSPQSMLADAAEELTFAASEKVETKLARRKATAGGGVRTEALEKAEQYLKQVHSKQSPEKLEKLLNDLKQEFSKNPEEMLRRGGSELLRQARRAFKDGTDQYTALEYVSQMLGEGDEALLGLVQEAMAQAMAEDGEAIRAGLNIAEAISQHSTGTLDGDQQLRDFYRDTLFQNRGLAGTYEHIVESKGEENFSEHVQFLLKALSDDLGAKGPSIGPNELKAVIDDMYQLEVLSGVHEECGDLVGKMVQRTRLKKGASGHQIMKDLLKLKEERFIQAAQVEKITTTLGLRDLEPKIYFLRELKETARLIPLKAYEDPANREKLLDAIQEALDDAIDLEEEEDYDE